MNEQTETVNEIVMTEEALQEEIGHLQGRIDKADAELRDLRRKFTDQHDQLQTMKNNTQFALHMLEATKYHVMNASHFAGVIMLVSKALESGYPFNEYDEIPF